MMARPRKRTGPLATAPPRTTTTGKQFGASVTRLDDWKTSRLTRPWPGWWGGAEVRSWTWAERSRRAS
jgi:hypothetical protein